jgi:hypothetical protein
VDSRGARAASGVGSQSVLSATEAESKDGMMFNVKRKKESRKSERRRPGACSRSLGVVQAGFEGTLVARYRVMPKTGLKRIALVT